MTRLLSLVAATLLVSFVSLDSAWSRGGSELIDKALERAFPKCTIERIVCRLGDDERAKVNEISEQKKFSKKTTFAYVARREGKVVGTAFFDSHVVRSKRETLMVAINPDGTVRAVETVVFNEPPEYLAQDAFYESLSGRGQGRPLTLGRGLDSTTGATLTCRAVANAARRTLALHEVLGEKVGREKPAEKRRNGGGEKRSGSIHLTADVRGR